MSNQVTLTNNNITPIIKLDAKLRYNLGKKSNQILRKNSLIPCVIYGDKQDALHIVISEHDFDTKIKKCIYNTKIALKISDEKTHNVMVHAIEYDKITDKIIHIDFLFIDISNDNIKCPIPIKFINSHLSPGIKRGGFLNIVSHAFLTQCKTEQIPQYLIVDLENLETGTVILAEKIQLPTNCELVIKKNKAVIASIIGKKSSSTAQKEQEK